MKKVLVTGGAGYLGKHIAKELNKAGHFVICLDKKINFRSSRCKIKD